MTQQFFLPWLLRGLMCLVFVLPSGCGFHLRGEGAELLALSDIDLRCANQDSWHLCQSLRQYLVREKVSISPLAPIRLTVRSPQQKQKTIALSADADAAEYMVTQEVELELSHQQEQFTTRRTLLFASHALKNRESAALQEQGEYESLALNLQQRLADQTLEWLALQLDDLNRQRER